MPVFYQFFFLTDAGRAMCLHFLSGAGEGFRGSGVRCGSGVGLTRWGPSCPELLGAGRARLQTTALKNKPPAAWQGVLGLPQCTRGTRQALAVGGVQRAQQCWGRRAVRGACGVSSHDVLMALRPSTPIKVVILTYRPVCLVCCSAAGPGAAGRGPPESAESSSAWS